MYCELIKINFENIVSVNLGILLLLLSMKDYKPIIVRVIKYRRLRWANHVARMEEDRIAFKILTG